MILLPFYKRIQLLFQKTQCRRLSHNQCPPPRHLICFKQWTPEMVMEIIHSAINLKRKCDSDTHATQLDILKGHKIMILQEINQPILKMAVSKAVTLLGAHDVTIIDHLVWEHDYNGRIFSSMSDAIFVTSATHMCVQRLANQSSVPVMCLRSRAHGSMQALATVMAIIEEYGTMENVNLAWIGPPHPVLNSYLLLCPMLGANIKFKCWCQKQPVTPLLLKASEDMCVITRTETKECETRKEALKDSFVIIAGPTTEIESKREHFTIKAMDIYCNSPCANWIFFHTCPRGKEVDDYLFNHRQSRTFDAFNNMQFVAAALLANSIKGYNF